MRNDAPILVYHPGALGDVVATFDNLLRLKQRFPGGVEGVCQNALGKLGCTLGIFRRAFPVESSVFAGLYAETSGGSDPVLGSFFRPYGGVVLFSNSQHLERGISRVFHGPVYRIPPRPPLTSRIHIHDHVSGHLVAAGLLTAVNDGASFPKGFPSAKRRKGASKTVFIHPGSGSLRKNWPSARFAALARCIRQEGMVPEFILGPAEDHIFPRIAEDVSGWTIHTPATLDAFVTFLKRADGYVGNDAGASHLAAFLGLPTLAIFGPSDPVRWRPRGPRTAIVTPADLKCRPCFERTGENCEGSPCLLAVTAPDVTARLLELLSDCG